MSLTKSAPKSDIVLSETEQPWARVVLEKARALRYGTIHIKVHEAQVVLVEATEQTRFELTARPRA